MVSRALLPVAATWMAALAPACGGRAAGEPAMPEAPEPAIAAASASEGFGLQPGEAMQFEVTVGGVLAGEAAIAVGTPGEVDGRRAVAVRSKLESAGAAALIKRVVDDATTVVDLANGHPISLDTEVVYGDTHYTASAKFAGSVVDVQWERKDKPGTGNAHFEFGTKVGHDAHTAMAALRLWRAPSGARRTVWVVGGRRLWRADMTMAGNETIATRLGNRVAIRLDGIAYRAKADLTLDTKRKSRKFSVWLSDDADRVPLRVTAATELGDVVIELTDYQRP
jgi:hypothetical protein